MHERPALGRTLLLYDNADRERLAELGEVRAPGLADLFLALVGADAKQKGGRMSARNAFLWSLRREWWENRSIYIAPVIVAAVALAGFVFAAFHHSPGSGFANLPPAKQLAFAAIPYGIVASIILLTGWIVGIFYAADSLYGDRRDRSVLFWKSMPVSDVVTVAAKACVPLVVIPLFACAVAILTQLAMQVLGSAIVSATGGDSSLPWRAWPLGRQSLVMLYGVGIHILWFAPIYAWLMLVSAWVKRAVLMWAFLPLFAAFALERFAFGSTWLASAVKYRIVGAMSEGFVPNALTSPVTELSQLDPGRFFSNPYLWLGLVFAAACFALAVRRRQYGEPI
jgi:ABC-2 type transport system permease protein